MTDTDTPITDAAAPQTPEIEIEAPTEPIHELGRPQKRLLKRLYNARTVPVIADERPFLTYKDALRYLLTLPLDAQDAAYAQMKAQARDKVR
ncbi:hypothetical protein U5A82_10715 [Sphingobium sp. CR2-8]|uniref:hypothetical protein n=1 Tax=Sphingobium sp. CR2-8 TaxID=1306534 RepID=UPI002DBA7947|nr:hypothetical protein [Sphingobium sp. CR2-8]MEC3910925.1 hypothetical protein [Sphingobium sp. CR2-8]